jgi:hypothetical protein
VSSWAAIAIFLLGAGIGALLTMVMYTAQMGKINKLVRAASAREPQAGQHSNRECSKGRKSV